MGIRLVTSEANVPKLSNLKSGRWYAPLGTVSTGATPTNGTMRASPLWVPNTTTFDRIGIVVTVAGGAGSKYRLGIYADDAGFPGALVLDSGEQDGLVTGDPVAVTISQEIIGGRWIWLACGCYGGTAPTLGTVTSVHNPQVGSTMTAAGTGSSYLSPTAISGALPATFGTPSTSATGGGPRVGLRAV